MHGYTLLGLVPNAKTSILINNHNTSGFKNAKSPPPRTKDVLISPPAGRPVFPKTHTACNLVMLEVMTLHVQPLTGNLEYVCVFVLFPDTRVY